MTQKLPVNNFKWVKYISKSDEGYFLEVDVQCSENLHDFTMIYHFLSERMEIQKFGKLATNLHDKTECFIIVRNLNKH